MTDKHVTLPPSGDAVLCSPAVFPLAIQAALEKVHPSWLPAIHHGLLAIEARTPDYLASLIDGQFLPDQGRLFAAFSRPLEQVRYVLVGEGPYPRSESATGVCFMDGAVDALWSDEAGLSKK